MPVNSAVGYPERGDIVRTGNDGAIEVKGYAVPHGADGPVVKAEVSADEGISWYKAQLLCDEEGKGKWLWVLWQSRVKLQAGKNRRILSRAINKEGNVQEKNPIWNLRRVVYNGYGEVRDLTVETEIKTPYVSPSANSEGVTIEGRAVITNSMW
jgi:sulfite oxidase